MRLGKRILWSSLPVAAFLGAVIAAGSDGYAQSAGTLAWAPRP
jgi:hypothetical protein